MSLQIRRGTDSNRLSIIPKSGELLYTTDTKALYVGDGTTAGGTPVGGGGGGGGGGSLNAVASGALTSGHTVIVNADGTVSMAGGPDDVILENNNPALVSPFGYAANGPEAVYDADTNSVVVAYPSAADWSSVSITVVVGTVSNNTITFGTPITVYSTTSIYSGTISLKLVNCGTNKIALLYTLGGVLQVVAGTLNGSSLTMGNPVTIDSDLGWQLSTMCYNSTADKLIIAYSKTINNYRTGYIRTGSISGNSVSVSSSLFDFGQEIDSCHTLIYNPVEDKTVFIANIPWFNTNAMTVITLGQSNNLTVGGFTTLDSTIHPNFSATVVAGKTIVSFSKQNSNSNTDSPCVAICNTSNWTATLETIYKYSAELGNASQIVAITGTNRFSMLFTVYVQVGDNGFSKLRYIEGTVDGSGSISFATGRAVSGSNTAINTGKTSLAYLGSNFAVMYSGYVPGQYTTRVYSNLYTPGSTNLTDSNYIGISDDNYANGEEATIQITGSVNDAQSGLTPGVKYYVQDNGTIASTPTFANVYAGTAVSSTKIIIKG